jgi:hypothetical protein
MVEILKLFFLYYLVIESDGINYDYVAWTYIPTWLLIIIYGVD